MTVVVRSRVKWARFVFAAAVCLAQLFLGACAGMAVSVHEEDYYGYRIRIVTSRRDDGTWRSVAELRGDGVVRLSVEPRLSEEEAHHAALAVAMVEADRRRAGTGKP
jgi:hypothetical protein